MLQIPESGTPNVQMHTKIRISYSVIEKKSLFFLGKHIDPSTAANLSTLFDVGGILGGIAAGLISDITGKPASTCAVMLIAAIPSVRLQFIMFKKYFKKSHFTICERSDLHLFST